MIGIHCDFGGRKQPLNEIAFVSMFSEAAMGSDICFSRSAFVEVEEDKEGANSIASV